MRESPVTMKKILVVDDEIELCEAVKGYLSERSFEVRAAHHGEEALAVLDQFTPDLMIVDVAMPVMDGFKLLDHLKSDARFSSIPVVILTAKSDQKNLKKGIALQAEFFLPKPFTGESLIQYIDLILGS